MEGREFEVRLLVEAEETEPDEWGEPTTGWNVLEAIASAVRNLPGIELLTADIESETGPWDGSSED